MSPDAPLSFGDLYPCGRKFCTDCRRWRPIHDFRHRVDHRRHSIYLRSRCLTCERISDRQRLGIKHQGKPYGERRLGCQKGHHPKYRKWGKCQICARKYQTQPEYQEYQRFRRGGLSLPPTTAPKDRKETTRLSPAPFAAWLRELEAVYGHDGACLRTGMSGRSIRRIYENEEKGSFVHIDVVDKALCNEGNTLLWELYPELYPDLEAPPKLNLLPQDTAGILVQSPVYESKTRKAA